MALQVSRGVDTPYAWLRLVVSVMLSTLGGVGMWSVVVALPAVQAEFGTARGSASLPYTLTMIGFAAGGVLMGRLADRFGVLLPVLIGAVALGSGYCLAAVATTLGQFAIISGLLIGIGTSATFVPLLADISRWFDRRRGIAVAICASGNYFAGAIWPPVVGWLIGQYGWRETHVVIGAVCLMAMLPLAFLLRGKPVVGRGGLAGDVDPVAGTLGLPPAVLQAALAVAGLACCVAMAMPQVHIVAYCGDLGYGVARGAEMLSIMLACGVVSRIACGFIADRIGGLPTLLLSSLAQMTALVLYMFMDGLTSLYVISALFGLFQGGIVPSYAIVIRECFPAREAGQRVGVVIAMTLLGMALGAWMSGVIFDLTGSYRAAFANGVAWNVLNAGIAVWLLRRRSRSLARTPALFAT